MNIKITICTPTYNRGYLLSNLYESLIRQSFKEFEWVIIDDGSNDNTAQIVEDFKQTNDINIHYVLKKNGGKHTALNIGIKEAKGELFFVVDSDDVLTKNSLEEIWNSWERIEDKNEFAGIAGAKGYSEDRMIGDTFEGNYLDASYIDLRFLLKIAGDKAEVYRTDIMKRNLFPEFNDEKFLTEAVIWNRIANDNLKVRWVNKIVYIAKYLDGGLTDNYDKLMANNWRGTTLYYKEILKSNNIPRSNKYRVIRHEYCRYLKIRGINFKSVTELTSNPLMIVYIYSIYYLKDYIKNIIRRIRGKA